MNKADDIEAMCDLAEVLEKHDLVITHDLEDVRIERKGKEGDCIVHGFKMDAKEMMRWAINWARQIER